MRSFFLLTLSLIFLPIQSKSAEIQIDSVLLPPSSVRCGDGKMGYGLYWVDQSKEEAAFKIYQSINTTDSFTVVAEMKSRSVGSVGTEYYYPLDHQPEQFYLYYVTSVAKKSESQPSNWAVLPKRPINLTGHADSISVVLNWAYPDNSLAQLIFVERSLKPDEGYEILAPIISQNGVRFIDYSMITNTDYYYRIRSAVYDSKSRVTSYSLPTQAIGPFRKVSADQGYDGLLSFHGKEYRYKTFGKQTWMLENLAYLPAVYPAGSTSVSENRFYVFGYHGSDVAAAEQTDSYRKYGALYNWVAATDGYSISPDEPIGVQGICPDGWHLPGNKEWLELRNDLNRVQLTRDSVLRADAQAKGVKGVQNTRFEGDFALPVFNDFQAQPGGWYRSDSNRFSSFGALENYWSPTSRITNEKGLNIKDADKGSGYYVRCVKGAALPTVITADMTDISETHAIAGGKLVRTGGAGILSKGVCWSTMELPDIQDQKVETSISSASYDCPLKGLVAGTIYFIRAYATNSAGTAYGEQKQFVTAGTPKLPVLLTGEISDITGSSAAVGGSLMAYGGSMVSERGVCWNTKGKPLITDHKVPDFEGNSIFTCYLPELNPGTTYFVRAYAKNSAGVAYGKKGAVGTFDYQGHTYPYATIGTQTWMIENLAYLPSVSTSHNGSENEPYYYVYGYEGNNVDSAKAYAYYKKYGVLYNWVAARQACPSGWHLPSEQEMKQLTDFLTHYGYGFGGSGNDIAKSLAYVTGWDSMPIPGSIGYDQALNNRSGFRAVPAGQRTVPRGGMVSNVKKAATFWTTTEFKQEKSSAYALVLFYSHDVIHPYPNADKRNGYSVRCLKDN